MSRPADVAEIAFTVEGEFVPMPRAKPNRHGQLRIPSDHPVHKQTQRIRQAARAAGATPVADAAVAVEFVIHGPAGHGTAAAAHTLVSALEGVAFKDPAQVARIITSRQPQEDGNPPHFTVLIKRLQNLFDTF